MADPIERLEHALLRLPGVGKKSAQRLAYFVLSEKHDYANTLAQAVVNARAETRICGVCGAPWLNASIRHGRLWCVICLRR